MYSGTIPTFSSQKIDHSVRFFFVEYKKQNSIIVFVIFLQQFVNKKISSAFLHNFHDLGDFLPRCQVLGPNRNLLITKFLII